MFIVMKTRRKFMVPTARHGTRLRLYCHRVGNKRIHVYFISVHHQQMLDVGQHRWVQSRDTVSTWVPLPLLQKWEHSKVSTQTYSIKVKSSSQKRNSRRMKKNVAQTMMRPWSCMDLCIFSQVKKSGDVYTLLWPIRCWNGFCVPRVTTSRPPQPELPCT